MSLKVLVVGTYAPDRQYSLTGFARALCAGLPAHDHDIEARLISPSTVLGESIFARGKARNWAGHWDKLAVFPRRLQREARWADVVHLVDHGLAVYCKYLQQVPHLVTCNDLIAMRAARGDLPEWNAHNGASPLPSPRFQNMIAQGLECAQHVVCISHATQADLQRLTNVPAHNSSVIYDSLFHSFEPIIKAEVQAQLHALQLDISAPYVLHLGRDVPTKNRAGLLKIFAGLRRRPELANLQLVMAGGELSSAMRQQIAAQKLAGVVHERSHLQDVQIRALYAGAQALIFPSFYEGFGLPIIEAQACDCLVFTSNRAPMTEVGGKGACYFDPAQSEAAAQIIGDVLCAPQELEKLRQLGRDNLARFAPATMFRAYSERYRKLSRQNSANSAASICSEDAP